MQSIYPVLKYEDAQAAIDFLGRAFGFERLAVHEGDGGAVVHAELRFGDQVVMVSSAGVGNPVFDQGVGRTTTYLVVDEVDSLHDSASAAGAEIVMPPTDEDYGSRDFAARDPEGNIWSFGTYRPSIET
ncbi:MAG: VOC family protein [Thermoleophilaceae bacterium]|nr:VOC family protein [Thermoleophilaceae bacterium]